MPHLHVTKEMRSVFDETVGLENNTRSHPGLGQCLMKGTDLMKYSVFNLFNARIVCMSRNVNNVTCSISELQFIFKH